MRIPQLISKLLLRRPPPPPDTRSTELGLKNKLTPTVVVFVVFVVVLFLSIHVRKKTNLGSAYLNSSWVENLQHRQFSEPGPNLH